MCSVLGCSYKPKVADRAVELPSVQVFPGSCQL